jgi:hypothetical protein
MEKTFSDKYRGFEVGTAIELEFKEIKNTLFKSQNRNELAAEILCAMIRVPENRNTDFDTLSDFAVRQADSLIKKLNEPEI